MTHETEKKTTAATRSKERRRRKPPIVPRTGKVRTLLTGDDGPPDRPKRPPEDILFGPEPSPATTGREPAGLAAAPRTAADILFGGSGRDDKAPGDLGATKVAQATGAPPSPPSRLPKPKPQGPTVPGPAPATILGGGSVLPGVPAYKSGFFTNPANNPPGTFQRFTGAVGNLTGATATETRIYQEIFAAEGGVDVAPNGASSGITRTTLNDTIDRQRFSAVPRGTRPDQLTIDQRAAFYRAYFDDVLGAAAAALSTGRGPQSALIKGHELLSQINDPFAAVAFADALFHHGRGNGTRVIQQAIEELDPSGPGDPNKIDGKMGPSTLKNFQRLAADPTKRSALLNVLSKKRAQLLQREALRRGQSVAQGDLDRVEHFRFSAVR